MENNNKKRPPQVGPTSTPSLTSQLFGSQSSSSNDVFASIFPPSNKGIGRDSNSEVRGNGNQPWNGTQDNVYGHGDTTYSSSGSKERESAYQQDQRVEPSYLSSSLYYGAQETYSNPSTHSTSTSYSTLKKDSGEEESSGASRGNWWQGSLYY